MRKKEHISSPTKLATLPTHRERMNRLGRLGDRRVLTEPSSELRFKGV